MFIIWKCNLCGLFLDEFVIKRLLWSSFYASFSNFFGALCVTLISTLGDLQVLATSTFGPCSFAACAPKLWNYLSDLDSRLAYPRPRPRLSRFKTKTKTKTQQFQDQDQDSADSRPRPRPRLSRFKTKTKTKTQQFQDQDQDFDVQDQDRDSRLTYQYWKFMTGINCDKQKDWKSHGKQKIQHTGSCTE